MPLTLAKKVCGANRYAATSHHGVVELADIEEIIEEDKNKWLFGFKVAEGRKHRMIRAVEGKKKFL